MNKIDILSHLDNNYYSLYETFFLSSYKKYLSKNFNLIPSIIETKNTDSFFESKHWSKIIIDRFDILCDYIQNNKNKWAIFSDIDIIFFDDIQKEICAYTKLDNIPIWYMAENFYSLKKYSGKSTKYLNDKNQTFPQINGGFFLFYCCDEIEAWFRLIKLNIELMTKPNDQTFIQNILNAQKNFQIKFKYNKKEYQFIYGILNPIQFATNNNEIITIIQNLDYIKVFHATSSADAIEKFQILSSIYIKKYKISGINLWI
jgi:hypothetical protein